MIELPGASYLRAAFTYTDGQLIWRYRDTMRPQWNARYAGKVAGAVVEGRVIVALDGKRFKAHRIIWKMKYGNEPSEIDHIDCNALNNDISNLRLATRKQNMRNRRGRAGHLKGVSFHKKSGRWRSRILVNGAEVCKYHATPELAHANYCAMAHTHFGEFARFA